jgi:hypothetical protein
LRCEMSANDPKRTLAVHCLGAVKKDPSKLFDERAIRAQARPGMIATNNTDPVFLVLIGLTGSSVDPRGSAVGYARAAKSLASFTIGILARVQRFSNLSV